MKRSQAEGRQFESGIPLSAILRRDGQLQIDAAGRTASGPPIFGCRPTVSPTFARGSWGDRRDEPHHAGDRPPPIPSSTAACRRACERDRCPSASPRPGGPMARAEHGGPVRRPAQAGARTHIGRRSVRDRPVAIIDRIRRVATLRSLHLAAQVCHLGFDRNVSGVPSLLCTVLGALLLKPTHARADRVRRELEGLAIQIGR